VSTRSFTLPAFDDDALCCPHCGCNYTHQHGVEIFDRSEDAATGLFVGVHGKKLTVNTEASMKNCPSSRRHGVRILFDCESCDAESELTIVQHKGNTYINARVLYVKPPQPETEATSIDVFDPLA